MPYLIAAVVLIGLACAANLMLTFGVIRRLKAAADLGAAAGPGRGMPPLLPVGGQLPAFRTQTVGGGRLDNAALAGARTLIGFFSTQCEPCREHAPDFLRYAAAEKIDPERVVAVVQGTVDQTSEFVGSCLRGGADVMVVAEPDGGPVAKSLGAVAFPQFYLVDGDGTLETVELSINLLPTTAGA
jgi:thiol-disulfide isomerase/thioredoxin